MAMATVMTPGVLERPARRPAVPSGVLAMLMFVICEVMFFAGLISAFTIVKSGTVPGMWPPPGQPRLSPGSTAFNTAALLLSAPLLVWSYRRFRKGLRGTGPLLLA